MPGPNPSWKAKRIYPERPASDDGVLIRHTDQEPGALTQAVEQTALDEQPRAVFGIPKPGVRVVLRKSTYLRSEGSTESWADDRCGLTGRPWSWSGRPWLP